MKERSHPQGSSGLDLAIDASLRRRFTPPAGLEARLELPPARGTRGGGLGRWATLAAFLAAAAALVALLLRSEPTVLLEPVTGPGRIARVRVGLPPSAAPAIGPLAEACESACEIRPDFVRLYQSMAAAHRSQVVSACGEGDHLTELLENTYGPGVQLAPGAAQRLHGPFGSEEWPTGTILTGTIDGQMSLLIFESDRVLSCCADLQIPSESGLNAFTWFVGDVAYTEITPLEEPRLSEECLL